MSAVVRDLLRRGSVASAILAVIDHPSSEDPLRYWSGLGEIDYDGETYIGLGAIGNVTPLESNTEVEVSEIRFSISGVDPDHLEGLDDSVKGRTAQLFEAWLDEHYRIVHVESLVDARCDYQVYRVDPDGGKAGIDLVATAGFFFMLNRSAAKVSPEEQKALFPADTGFDEMHLQQDQQLIWKPS